MQTLEEALVAARAAAEPYTLAAVLTSLGATRDALSESARALTAYEEARRLRREVGDRRGEAGVLVDIGQVHAASGDAAKGLDFEREALEGMREAGDAMGEATVLNGMGAAHETLGERLRAIELYGQARRLFRGAGNAYGEGITLQNLGRTFAAVGEMQKALEALFEALSAVRTSGDRAGEAYTLTSIGAAYTSLGEPQTATRYLQKALLMVRETGDRTGEASTLDCIGVARTELKDHAGALDAYEKARVILHEAGIRPGEAYVLTNMSARFEALGRVAEARDAASRSLALMREIGDRSGEAFALAQEGSVEASQGERDQAAEHLRRAIELHRETGNPIGEAEALESLARVERGRGDLRAARERVENALGVIESLRTRVASRSLQQSYFSTVRDSYDLAVDILMRLHRSDPSGGYDRLALRVSERSRARVLLELLTQAASDVRAASNAETADRERALTEKMRFLMERLKGLGSAASAASERAVLEKRLDDLTAEYERLEARTRAADPRYAGLSDPRPLDAAQIQAEIGDDDTALLEYSLGKERSYLWVVTRAEVFSFELAPAAEIEAAAREVYAKVSRSPRPGAPSAAGRSERRLSDLLWKSAAAQLRPRRWVIVADGAVAFVPFSALPEPGQEGPLVARHEVVTLPSASSLAALRSEAAGRGAAERTLAILADPVFERGDPRVRVARAGEKAPADSGTPPTALERSMGDLSTGAAAARIGRLPFTRQEANAISALVPSSERLVDLDFDASRQAATSAELGRYRYVHFATHGVIDAVHPNLSGLVFSLVDRDGTPKDGFLAGLEIFNLRLSADLVVLSACRTALGKEIRGEGLVGLTRAFLYAGAPRVVASLWRVDDAATAELMKDFYERMLGPRRLPPAAALRQAQLAVSRQKRWRDPYYWAAFVLEGEWN